MNEPSTSQPGSFLRSVSILFNALVIGVILFLVMVSALVYFIGGSIHDEKLSKIFLAIVAVIAVTSLVAGTAIYKKRIAVIAAGSDVQQKLIDYRSTLVLYLALCEGAALFSIICLFLTGSYWFAVITIIMLAAMLAKKPARQKIVNELDLNFQDEQQL